MPKTTLSVLVVEDVEEMRGLIEHVLQGIDGLKISGIAGTCVEARLELTRRRPQLVLLDEVLPGESSYDLLKELNEEKIPVILITSLEAPSAQLPLGAFARISKPGWKTVEEDRIRIKKVIFSALESSQA